MCQIHEQQRRIEELTAQVKSPKTLISVKREAFILLFKMHSSKIFSPPAVQSEKDQAEMKELHETVQQQNKTIKRFNRGEALKHGTRMLTEEVMMC